MTSPQDPFATPPERGAEGSSSDLPVWGAPAAGDQPAAGSPAAPPPGQQPGQWGGQPGWGGQAGQQQWGGGGAPPAGGRRNGLGTAALVLGVLALVLCWTIVGGIVLGIAAIVLGVLGRSRARKGEASNGGMAVAGLVLGVLGLLAAGAIIALGIAAFNSADFQNLTDCLESAQDQSQVEDCQREFEDSFGQ